MVDLALIAYSMVGAICVALAIVLVTNRAAWLPIIGRVVSIISGDWRASLERARLQKAQRERLYGYAEPEPLSSDEFSLLNDAEPETNGSENAAELQLNAAEVSALHRMIEHNKTAAKPSKSSTIQAGFGVSRGGSSAYQRASLIYDTLFGPPQPAIKYRPRTPEQDALRQQLGLERPAPPR